MPKRPPLSAVIGPGQPLEGESPQSDIPANESAPAMPTPTSTSTPKSAEESYQQGSEHREKAPAVQRSVRRPRKDYRQLNVLVPKEIVQSFKIKAIQEERELSDIVTELLARWLNLPVPPDNR